MIRVLPPWFENLGKRLVKSPKVYLRDSGMLHFLLGLEDRKELHVHPLYGASWEGFALEQTLLAHGGHEAYFYSISAGCRTRPDAPAPGKALGLRVQVHRGSPHHEVDACRHEGSRS